MSPKQPSFIILKEDSSTYEYHYMLMFKRDLQCYRKEQKSSPCAHTSLRFHNMPYRSRPDKPPLSLEPPLIKQIDHILAALLFRATLHLYL